MEILVKMIFGSHLYGTATDKSDRDYKGIFLPPLSDLLLCQSQKSHNESTKFSTTLKNTSADIDSEYYSLQYFLRLASQGETVALDMLHAPPEACLITSAIWEDLVSHRTKLYTRNLNSLVRYARRQAAKYGVKGSRLQEAQTVLDFFSQQETTTRLLDVWQDLPTGTHIVKSQNEKDLIFEVCGKKMVAHGRCSHYIEMLMGFITRYGARAHLAKQNEGIDWKAISHAFRAAYQVKHILIHGGFTYPLPEREYLLAIKEGELDYTSEVAPQLDTLIDEVESLSKKSELPEHVDKIWWQEWLLNALNKTYNIRPSRTS